ncbi:hypothetical protein NKH77_03280 [Streptomyces sp. M19]
MRSRLPLWGYREDVCDAAELVVSELFTNAIVHTASEHVRCLLRAEEERLLYVEVADQGGDRSAPPA